MPIQIGQRPAHGFDEPLGLLSDCHRRIERFLGILIATADQASGSALTAVHRANLAASLVYFATGARLHTADEEDSLFPRLRQRGDAGARDAVRLLARLEREHDAADGHQAIVDVLVGQWLVEGELAPEAVGTLTSHLRALQAIYEEHIAAEDVTLFPAAGRLLSPDEIGAIGREMAARRRVPFTDPRVGPASADD